MLRDVFVAILMLALSIISAWAGSRIALVVGVSKYENAALLPNTLNDARDMSAALRRLGFDVETLVDPGRSALEAAVRRYGDRSIDADVSLFHFSGHALEAGEHNWLLPATANLATERELRFEAVDLNMIREQADGTARISIIFLDACRDNPFIRRLSTSRRDVSPRGLARVDIATGGVLVAFSTAPGQVALDNVSARKNSPFTAALLNHIETPGLEIKNLLALVTKEVLEETKGRQRPWQNSSLEGDFYFLPPPRVATAPSVQAAVTLEGMFWDSIKTSHDPADFKAYLVQFPKGVFVDLAQNRMAALQQEISPGLKSSVSPPDIIPGPSGANPPPTPQSSGTAPAVRPAQPTEPPADSSTPTFSVPDNIDFTTLLERARGLIVIGDITAARLILRRADNYGDPRAALELGGTYDPLVLKRSLRVGNYFADVVQARRWYKRAADLGSADAVQRIKELSRLNQ